MFSFIIFLKVFLEFFVYLPIVFEDLTVIVCSFLNVHELNKT